MNRAKLRREQVKRMAEARRRSMPKRRLRKKPPKMQYPHAIEREFNAALQEYVDEMTADILQAVTPLLPRIQPESPATDSVVSYDDFIDDLTRLAAMLRLSLEEKADKRLELFSNVAGDISNFGKEQLNRVFLKTIGLDIFFNDDGLQQAAKNFSRENARLIKNLANEKINQTAGIITRAVQSGRRPEDTLKEIAEKLGVAKGRARVIARTETAKLNGQIAKKRQEELGVEKYVWRTSDDERVRTTHRAHDDKEFRWDEPPPTTGHPGNDFNCRCYAEPVLDEFQ